MLKRLLQEKEKIKYMNSKMAINTNKNNYLNSNRLNAVNNRNMVTE